MNIFLLNPLDRSESGPIDIPFELATLASIADSAGHFIGLFDLNAYREANTPEAIVAETKGKEWDLLWANGSFMAYKQLMDALRALRKQLPTAVIVLGGKIASYMPEEALKLNPEIDLCVIGDQYEAFPEILDKVTSQRWDGIDGVAYVEDGKVVRTRPRKLKLRSDQIPFPGYFSITPQRYFGHSALLYCQESLTSRQRMSFMWGRAFETPKGKMKMKFCSPKRAAKNITYARLQFRYGVDFASIGSPSFKWDSKWVKAFTEAYMEEELFDYVPFSCYGDADYLAKDPEIVRWLKEAGCRAIIFDFGTFDARNSVPRQKAVDLLRKNGISAVVRQTMGYPKETFDDLMEAAYFLRKNAIDIFDVSIVAPYPDTPWFLPNRKKILEQYDGDLNAFLSDETKDVTANISEFGTDSLIALKALMRSKDLKRMLGMAHSRGWKHDEKWDSFCPSNSQTMVPSQMISLSSAPFPKITDLFPSSIVKGEKTG